MSNYIICLNYWWISYTLVKKIYKKNLLRCKYERYFLRLREADQGRSIDARVSRNGVKKFPYGSIDRMCLVLKS